MKDGTSKTVSNTDMEDRWRVGNCDGPVHLGDLQKPKHRGSALLSPMMVCRVMATELPRRNPRNATLNDKEDRLRSEAVLRAHRKIPERFALCAIGSKAVRALHPNNEMVGTTINRVFWLISEERQGAPNSLLFGTPALVQPELLSDAMMPSSTLLKSA